jgi:hypothetical protein
MKYLFFIAVVILASCSGTRHVIPLKKGENAVSADLGGPLFKFSGLVIPMPLTSLAYSRGVSDKLTVTGAVHTTSLLFGVYHLEGRGLMKMREWNEGRSGLSFSPGFHTMIDKWESRFSFYPYGDFYYYRFTGEKNNHFFAGMSLFFDVRSKKAFEVENSHRAIHNLTAGYKWVRPKFTWSVELKYLNFMRDNRNIVVEYIAPAHHGALGIYFGVTKTF